MESWSARSSDRPRRGSPAETFQFGVIDPEVVRDFVDDGLADFAANGFTIAAADLFDDRSPEQRDPIRSGQVVAAGAVELVDPFVQPEQILRRVVAHPLEPLGACPPLG